MEEIILQILAALRRGETVDDRALVKLVHAAAKRFGGDKRAFAKRRLLPFYQRVRREEPERWASWDVTPELEAALVNVLRMKPRRSASGVATITVITKPWPCSGSCVFCPNDVRCPKSYLHNEPACARAEAACYDPYLQVSARLTALAQMGHATDKIELIVLGGTWSDYPEEYQTWFVTELFRALNDDAIAGEAANPMLRGFADEPGVMPGTENAAHAEDPARNPFGQAAPGVPVIPPGVRERRAQYVACGLMPKAVPAAAPASEAGSWLPLDVLETTQRAVDTGKLTYNQAVTHLYAGSFAWCQAAKWQRATLADLEREHARNERARHRVVGLVVETRPDAITPEALVHIRRLGATKIQMGVQSVDQHILDKNGRNTTVGQIERAFDLLRLFGFKIHAHAMVNLLGATPQSDRADYRRFVTDPAFQPDEVKLYPCALIESARLRERYEAGEWVPYTEDDLVGVLAADVLATPAFCRVSRMIRDFSSGDIMAGNKKPNLRQMVEKRLARASAAGGEPVREIRYREIATSEVDVGALALNVVPYETSSTDERFLQWVTPEGRIAGFLRLSLPKHEAVADLAAELFDSSAPSTPVPIINADEAMIREVHVYGMATRVGEDGAAAQHHGLGRRLIERACELAREAGYERINVISAVGTREYYRMLGFHDHGLYQQRSLDERG
ncbi:elongator complex protein 3 [uncultured Enorma sp.]|uniref:elongator complex protein 3 n=1 Tax=uncultured Enorma sp. TaxID=1714346 RepID=UPI00265FA5B5|nr:tRNA uridine(34) 5-carboxymethylaminomethyl modification radical SAM/GNAT enzyme Elp3 [uncultured Enorma sp.]